MRSIGKRRRRDICKSHDLSLEIPHELQIKILTILPVKSLMRFKSVSKLWSLLISSRYFIDLYLKVSSPPLRLYMWLSFDNNPLNKVLLSSSSSSLDSDLSSFVVDQDLTIPGIQGYYVSHAYRGLMCFVNGRSAKIYNTSTRQLVDLPDIEELKLIPDKDLKWKRWIMYYIGHDPVHNQYKVVCIVSEVSIDMTEIWFLLLGEDHDSSQWRKISKPIHRHLPFLFLSKGSRLSIINGRMYYLAWIRLQPNFVLVSIDIRLEEISILQIPEYSNNADLIDFGGKLALLEHFDLKSKGVMDLWVLEDAENSICSKMKTLVLDPSQMHIVNGMSLRVQGTTRNGEIIFVPRNDKIIVKPQSKTCFYVFLYNIQNNHLRKVEIKETSNSHRTKFWDVIGFDDVENLMYL